MLATSEAQLPTLKRSRKTLWIVSAVLVAVIIVGISVSTLPSLNKTANSSQETVIAPKVEIVSTNLRTAPVEEHLAYVDANLTNTGGNGTVIVCATLTDEVNSFYGNQSVYFKAQESINLTITLTEVSFPDYSQVHVYVWTQIPEANNENRVMPNNT